jgi:phosphatidylserine/phosphatidylglycerophosphate/cardiolipin synthase-like enzyme
LRPATHYIWLEIYRFRIDPVGIRFRDKIIEKVPGGVEVRVLIDSWADFLPSILSVVG